MSVTDVYKECLGLPTWVVIFMYFFISVLLLAILGCGIWSVHKSIILHQKKEITIRFLILFLTPIIFFIITGITTSGIMIFYVEECEFDPSNKSSILVKAFWSIVGICYNTGLASLFLSFSTRLLYVFNGSIFEASKCIKYYLNIIGYSQFIFSLLLWIVLISFGITIVSIINGLILFSYIIHSIAITIIFEKKVKKLDDLITGTMTTTNAMDKKKSTNKLHIQLKEMAVKLLICVFFALLSTLGTITITMLGSFGIGDDNRYFELFTWMVFLFDVLVNSICLMLQWNFSNRLYFKMCNKCHKIVSRFDSNSNSNNDPLPAVNLNARSMSRDTTTD